MEVSVDGGTSWQDANILDEGREDDSRRSHGWRRWRFVTKLPKGTRFAEIVCRATDEKGNVQPRQPPINGGYIYNGWHRVNVEG